MVCPHVTVSTCLYPKYDGLLARRLFIFLRKTSTTWDTFGARSMLRILQGNENPLLHAGFIAKSR